VRRRVLVPLVHGPLYAVGFTARRGVGRRPRASARRGRRPARSRLRADAMAARGAADCACGDPSDRIRRSSTHEDSMHKALIIGVAIGLMACEGGGGAPGGAASGAPAGGKATTSLTKAQLDEAYKLTDPDKYDASVAAATGKLGKPAKSDANSSTW